MGALYKCFMKVGYEVGTLSIAFFTNPWITR